MGLNDVVATVGPGPGGTKQTSIRSYRFFLASVLAAPGSYATNPFVFNDADGTNFTSHSVEIINDSGADLFFSFDGTNDHGKIKAAETTPRVQDFRHEKGIWLRGTAGGAFRLSAW